MSSLNVGTVRQTNTATMGMVAQAKVVVTEHLLNADPGPLGIEIPITDASWSLEDATRWRGHFSTAVAEIFPHSLRQEQNVTIRVEHKKTTNPLTVVLRKIPGYSPKKTGRGPAAQD